MSKLFTYILCIGLFVSVSAYANNEKYTVEIKVDVSDENASIAREKALNSATRAAVNAIAKRLSTSDGAKKIADMSDAQIINFVKETSVINEKNSDVRYMAELKIVINEELIKEYMKEREIPLITKNINSVLIIPLFREFENDTPLLWESENMWRKAWENSPETSAIKFVSITKFPNLQSNIDAKQASLVDMIALENIASTSGINNVYVLDTVYNGIEGLTIKGSSLSGNKFNLDIHGAKDRKSVV